MGDMSLLAHFLFAAIATAGFSIFFNVPVKLLFPAAVVGGIGWIVYLIILELTKNPSLAGFLAAASVSSMSEFLARRLYQPAILFVICGILPLVPGISFYNTMLSIIQADYTAAIEKGANAFLLSCAIALGVLVVSALVRTVNIYRFKGDLLANLRIRKRHANYYSLESDDYDKSHNDDNEKNK